LLSRYKSAYLSSEFFLNVLKELNKKEPEEPQKNESSYRRKASIAATRSFDFIYRMRIGDFVVVPGVRSQEYLFGVIISEEFSTPISRNTDVSKECHFEFKREIHWIRTVHKKNFPSSLSWGLSAQKTIYDITDFAEDINKLLSSSYMYKERFYHQLSVNTPDPITSFQWYQFQRAIFEVAEEKSKEIYIKTNVQSPGIVEFVTNPANIPVIIAGIGILFGNVEGNIKGQNISIKGIVPYFLPAERAKRIAERKKHELEVKKIDSEIMHLDEINRINIKKQEVELEALELNNQKTIVEIEKEKAELAKTKEDVLNQDLNQTELFLDKTKIINLNTKNSLPKFDKEQYDAIEALKVKDPSIHILNKSETNKDSID
ncbi:MAG: hypothetical protein LBE23_12445, partial [Vagococcus sp.]|nr:hypothetical protein [Vagococcus sp.]